MATLSTPQINPNNPFVAFGATQQFLQAQNKPAAQAAAVFGSFGIGALANRARTPETSMGKRVVIALNNECIGIVSPEFQIQQHGSLDPATYATGDNASQLASAVGIRFATTEPTFTVEEDFSFEEEAPTYN